MNEIVKTKKLLKKGSPGNMQNYLMRKNKTLEILHIQRKLPQKQDGSQIY